MHICPHIVKKKGAKMNKKWKIVGIVACLGIMILSMNLSLDQRNVLAEKAGVFDIRIYHLKCS